MGKRAAATRPASNIPPELQKQIDLAKQLHKPVATPSRGAPSPSESFSKSDKSAVLLKSPEKKKAKLADDAQLDNKPTLRWGQSGTDVESQVPDDEQQLNCDFCGLHGYDMGGATPWIRKGCEIFCSNTCYEQVVADERAKAEQRLKTMIKEKRKASAQKAKKDEQAPVIEIKDTPSMEEIGKALAETPTQPDEVADEMQIEQGKDETMNAETGTTVEQKGGTLTEQRKDKNAETGTVESNAAAHVEQKGCTLTEQGKDKNTETGTIESNVAAHVEQKGGTLTGQGKDETMNAETGTIESNAAAHVEQKGGTLTEQAKNTETGTIESNAAAHVEQKGGTLTEQAKDKNAETGTVESKAASHVEQKGGTLTEQGKDETMNAEADTIDGKAVVETPTEHKGAAPAVPLERKGSLKLLRDRLHEVHESRSSFLQLMIAEAIKMAADAPQFEEHLSRLQETQKLLNLQEEDLCVEFEKLSLEQPPVDVEAVRNSLERASTREINGTDDSSKKQAAADTEESHIVLNAKSSSTSRRFGSYRWRKFSEIAAEFGEGVALEMQEYKKSQGAKWYRVHPDRPTDPNWSLLKIFDSAHEEQASEDEMNYNFTSGGNLDAEGTNNMTRRLIEDQDARQDGNAGGLAGDKVAGAGGEPTGVPGVGGNKIDKPARKAKEKTVKQQAQGLLKTTATKITESKCWRSKMQEAAVLLG
ncbi:unnamed protein product [Effrenium voratum]|uniref:Uncharacterized protein n=1 Tax=Effrenium voratum TaxID=2562239 RepID=A0AA36I4F7_9DINO|nr:unnamed protein product [Effrenium voratum]